MSAEALNMAEVVGNYIKHRRAPIAIPSEGGGYVLRYVPAISGESVAHAYQQWLAEEALKVGLKVCDWCRKGEMVKHGSRAILEMEKLKREAESVEEADLLEQIIIERCVVEDVGGFLVPTTVPVKRTSKFSVGYMIPALEDLKAASLDPQFHVRHAPSLIGREKELGITEKGQAIYYVELGSAIYTVSFTIDLDGIGQTSMVKIRNVITDNKELVQRKAVALKALYYLLGGMLGAKRTRFLPDYELLSVIAAVVKGSIFNVNSGHRRNYILNTATRAEQFTKLMGVKPNLLSLVKEGGVEIPRDVERAETLEEFTDRLLALANVKL